jgi:hypothetical protein
MARADWSKPLPRLAHGAPRKKHMALPLDMLAGAARQEDELGETFATLQHYV